LKQPVLSNEGKECSSMRQWGPLSSINVKSQLV